MSKGPGQGPGQGQGGRDGPQYSYGGRGRGRDGGRGGRGREGRGGRGPYATPSQNIPNPQIANNVPQISQGPAKNIPSNSADSPQDRIGSENINNNHSNTQSSVNSKVDVKKPIANTSTPTPTYANSNAQAPIKSQVQSSDAPRVRERGSILTSGVFAAVQNRQRTAGDRKDEKTRKDTTYDSSLPAHGQSRQQPIPRNGASKEQESASNQSAQNQINQSQSQSRNGAQGVHNQNNVNQNQINQIQRQKQATDTRQLGTRNSQNKVEKVENRGAGGGVVVDTIATVEDATRIELDSKMARAMKASAKEFKPTPSSSSPSPAHTESDDYYDKDRRVNATSGFVSGGNGANQGAARTHQHSESPNNIPTHQQQQQQHGNTQSQNIGVPISHTYPTNVYPNTNTAPRYTHTTVYEMPHQLITPVAYTENTIYTDRPYTETYMDGYMTQGGGQIMYNIDDRLSGGITGTGTGHRHQVLLTPSISMGIDTRTSGDMMTGQIGGTTYYDKGVTYYQDPSTYTDANVQYAPQGLSETFVPYRESRPYGDMHGQAILIGNDGLAVTMAYDDISGGYYPEESTETNRTELANGSSYYPQQSGALIPYVNYTVPAIPEGPKAKPLDLDGKAKPFSPSLVITSTATSTFSGLLASKLSTNVSVNAKKEKEKVIEKEKEIECVVDVDMSDAEEVEENDGTEERKGSKNDFVSTAIVAPTVGDVTSTSTSNDAADNDNDDVEAAQTTHVSI